MKYLKYITLTIFICICTYLFAYKVFVEKVQTKDPNIIEETIEKENVVEEQIIDVPIKEETPVIVEKQQIQENKKRANEEQKTNNKPITPKKETSEKQEEIIVPTDPVIEEKQEEVIDDTIVDTNDIFYSIHLGRVDTSTLARCISLGEELAFKYVEDIIYHNCIEVTSTTNKSLGYYLDLICNSGNCEKYKN